MPKSQNERREKIEKFLKEDRERKMNHKIPVQSQQLRVMKEDLVLKRKVAEQSESADKEYLAHAVKMTKNYGNYGWCHARMHANDEYDDSNASKSATDFQSLWFSSKYATSTIEYDS